MKFLVCKMLNKIIDEILEIIFDHNNENGLPIVRVP